MARDEAVLMVGKSAHDVLYYASAHLAEALQAAGRPCRIVRLGTPETDAQMNDAISNGRTLYFLGLNGMGSDLTTSGNVCAYEATGIPYFSLHADHPCYFTARPSKESTYVTFVYFNLEHYRASRLISPPSAMRCLLPHFGGNPPDGTPRKLSERSNSYVFVQQGHSPEAQRAVLQASPRVLRMIDDIVDAYAWKQKPVLEAVDERLAASGLLEGAHKTQLYWEVARWCDTLIRMKRATRLAQAIVELPGIFVGGSWDHLDRTRARARFVDPAPYPEVLALIDDAQVTVNVLPNNDLMPHERVANAMLRGSVAFTDGNTYLRNHFAGLYQEYTWDPDDIRERLAGCLGRIDTFQEMVESARERAIEVFDHRDLARRLEEIVDLWFLTRGRVTP